MNNFVSREMIIYLHNEIGLDESSIELGLKLSLKNKHNYHQNLLIYKLYKKKI